MVSVEAPRLTARYTYDSFGRRLSKEVSSGINETCLYQGEREIGVVEDGHITQLRVLGSGKGAELGAAIAIELDGILYAPLHDHRGNICALVNAFTDEPEATYRLRCLLAR